MIKVLATVLLVVVAAAQASYVTAPRRRWRGTSRALAAAAPVSPPPRDPLGAVAAALRTRRWARRSLSGLSVVLLLGAVGMIGFPFYTNLYQSRLQQRLHHQLLSPELRQAYQARKVDTGDALTRIRIPAIKVDVVVVEGTTSSALKAGAGHYPQTPLPCERGNVGIAGHRTTYGRPFHNLDLLRTGDIIVLETPVGECTYKIARPPFVVDPTDASVVAPSPDGLLTLTTCHPKGSARQRLVVRAVLEGPAASA